MALNVLVQVFSNLGLGFAAYFFLIHGVALYKVMMIWAISPLASIPVVTLPSTWHVRRYMRYGLLSFTGSGLSLLFFNQYSFLIFAVCSGLTLGFFWVSFNYVFFLNSAKERYARDSSIYFLLGPIIGIVMPPLGALLISSVGFRALFLLTVLLSLLPLAFLQRGDFDHTIPSKFREANRAFAGLRLITFFDGALHFFQVNFLTIYALLFLKTAYEVGGLLSYLALLSLLASFALAYLSDRLKRRISILYPLLIAMGIVIAIIPTIRSLPALVAVIGLYSILDNLSLPVRFAVPMDVVATDIGFWRMSEFYGNLGRTIVFAAAISLVYAGSYELAFLIFSAMYITFPFIINHKINRLNNLASDSSRGKQ